MATNTRVKQYVIDSSVVIAHLMVDETVQPEQESIIISYLNHKVNLYTSPILPFEIGNALKSAVLSKRINSKQARSLYLDFFRLEIALSPLNNQKILELSIKHSLSFYDASYLALAKKLKAPLLTLDKKLLSLTTK